ncbi:DUF6049 family protein [Actinoallomurus bryophytorum]|uniref:Uncharacterized protein n=1 Tax=Actinoallomurus bryophytorum TaxID=1490222 RepID=A0A543CKC7_9ACTN|nr:DUF6049 family protein [Actinoallomurus bryophytorum]TQL97525.1 hypothetical protein FB559_3116 [Actinoallomurus bryophytorum]
MRRLLALVIPLLLSGGPALAATPSPPHGQAQHTARASRDRQPAAKPPVAITLGSVKPAYLKASSTLRVSGRLVNQSQSTYQQVSVRLWFRSRAMTSRGEVETYADGKGPDPQQAGQPRVISATLPVGGQKSWRLSLSARQMGLRTFGVYPIMVEVRNSAGVVLGHQRTFVTYYPAGTPLQRTKVAWVWPLIDQPHRAADTTFVDDQLERQLGTGGRLSTIVGAARATKTPLSWLIDPSLVDDANKMGNTDGYNIKGDANRSQSVAALTWLTTLHNAVANDRLFATPYADPDVTALADRGMSDDVKAAAQEGTRALADVRLSGATTSTAMPPDGLPVDQATLSSLVASGSRTILLSSAVLPDARVETFTPDPVVNKNVSGTNVKLVAYDDTLRKILGQPTTTPGGTILAEQRFLAETAMITGEAPQNPRTIVITPPRRWKPSATFAKAVLNYTAKAPWLSPVPLSSVETLKPTERTFQPQKSPLGLSKNYLRQVRDLRSDVRKFTSIFEPPASDFTLGIARTESSAWNGQSRHGKLVRDTLKDELEKSMGRIKVLNDGTTMAGKSGRIPITISNGLDHGTVTVTLHAYSQNPTRLRVDAVDRTLRLEHGHKDQVTLDMKASANGIADVYLQLRTPKGEDFGGAHVLRVNASGYGRTALLITGISLAVLFVGVAIRIVRRRADRAGESVE